MGGDHPPNPILVYNHLGANGLLPSKPLTWTCTQSSSRGISSFLLSPLYLIYCLTSRPRHCAFIYSAMLLLSRVHEAMISRLISSHMLPFSFFCFRVECLFFSIWKCRSQGKRRGKPIYLYVTEPGRLFCPVFPFPYSLNVFILSSWIWYSLKESSMWFTILIHIQW